MLFSFKTATGYIFHLLLCTTNHATKFFDRFVLWKCYTVYKNYYFTEQILVELFFSERSFLKRSRIKKRKESHLANVSHNKKNGIIFMIGLW